MSRTTGDNIVKVKPTSNIYTVLAVVAFVATMGALLVIYMKAKELFGEGGLLGA